MSKFFISFILLLSLANQAFSQEPMFIENNGQFMDQNGNVRNDIFFKLEISGLNIFLLDNGFDIVHSKMIDKEKSMLSRVEYRFPAFKATSVYGLNQKNYTENYYSDHQTILANAYSEVIAIDQNTGDKIKFYSNEQGFKYDIILAAAYNQPNFVVNINGAETSLEDECVIISHPNIELKESMPLVYHLKDSKKIETKANYELTESGYIINFKKEDNKELVIDPFLTYATYYGGSGSDEIRALTYDQLGNYYFAGVTSSSNNIATTGAYQTVYVNLGNIFLAKFNDQNQRIWGTYFQSSYPGPIDLEADTLGNIYLAGITGSGDNMGTPGVHQTFFGGDFQDCFLMKFDENGFPVWSTLYGGPGTEILNQMILVDGIVYMAGYTTSDSLIATAGSFQDTKNGSSDAYIAKFDTSGQLIVATYLGGSTSDAIDGICYHDNSLFVSGNFGSFGLGTPGTYLPTKTSNSDLYFARFDTDLNQIWGSYFTGNSHVENKHRIAVKNDKIAIGFLLYTSPGNTSYATPGTHQDSALEGQSLCVLQFDTSGTNYNWGTYFDGNNWDVLTDIFYPNDTTILICGSTWSDSAIATTNVHKSYITNPGEHDVFAATFDQYGQQKWGTYYGGEEEDFPLDSKIDQNNHLLIGGKTKSLTAIPYGQAYQGNPTSNQWYDGFFFKLDIDRDSIYTDYNDILPDQICPKEYVSIEYQLMGTFHPDNVFQLWMSDENGSFANPTMLDSQLGTSPGLFSIQVPYLLLGGNYQFKVVSTSPEVEGNVSDQMSILESPETNFNYQVGINDVYFYDASATANSWDWDFSTGDFSVDQNPTYSFASAGNYPVTLISDNGICSDTAVHTVQINEVSGIFGEESELSIYPNPTADQWTLTLDNSIAFIEIYNANGELIMTRSANGEIEIIEVNEAGTYILVLLDAHKNIVKSIELVKT